MQPERVPGGAAAAEADQAVEMVPAVGLDDHVGHVHGLAADRHAVRLVARGAEDRAADGQDAGQLESGSARSSGSPSGRESRRESRSRACRRRPSPPCRRRGSRRSAPGCRRLRSGCRWSSPCPLDLPAGCRSTASYNARPASRNRQWRRRGSLILDTRLSYDRTRTRSPVGCRRRCRLPSISPATAPRSSPLPRGAAGAGSFGDLGPGPLALGEWQALGLELPDLAALRAGRLARLRRRLAAQDLAGIVVADPINLRYATDSANMQVWCLHNPVRYAFVATDGPVVLFDFHGCAHLSAHLALVDEVRPARAWYFFNSGARVAEHARAWAAELAEPGARPRRRQPPPRARPGRSRRGRRARGRGARAARRPGGDGARARAQDARRDQGDALRARDLRGGDARRCGSSCGPASPSRRCGRISHAGNIARGGEWIETRLLALGPAHQPLVPGVLEPGDRGGRPGRLRHRPDRPLRLLRRHLPHLALRRRPGQRGAERPLPPRAGADRPQPRADPPRPRLSRAVGKGLPAARALPRQPLFGDRPRRGLMRRVPGDLLPRGRRADRLRRRARGAA